MLVLVSYDVNTEDAAGRRRLVFECLVDTAQWVRLRAALEAEMDPDKDSLRFYLLGNNWRGRIEHLGCKAAYDPEGPLIF